TLQAAARAYGKHVFPGVQIERVIVIAAGGVRIASVAVPLCGESSPPPVADGWDFSEPMPRYGGVVVPIKGQRLSLLKLLAEAPGPLTVEQLKAAWEDGIAEEGTVRWTILKLKEALKSLFPQVAEPITNGEGGYSLALR